MCKMPTGQSPQHALGIDKGTDHRSDVNAIDSAIASAKLSTIPTIVKLRTTIGFGSRLQNTHGVHGSPECGAVCVCSLDNLFKMEADDPPMQPLLPMTLRISRPALVSILRRRSTTQRQYTKHTRPPSEHAERRHMLHGTLQSPR